MNSLRASRSPNRNRPETASYASPAGVNALLENLTASVGGGRGVFAGGTVVVAAEGLTTGGGTADGAAGDGAAAGAVAVDRVTGGAATGGESGRRTRAMCADTSGQPGS